MTPVNSTCRRARANNVHVTQRMPNLSPAHLCIIIIIRYNNRIIIANMSCITLVNLQLPTRISPSVVWCYVPTSWHSNQCNFDSTSVKLCMNHLVASNIRSTSRSFSLSCKQKQDMKMKHNSSELVGVVYLTWYISLSWDLDQSM